LIAPEVPGTLRAGKEVRRLFPDYHRREREYYRKTGIFPIMHALVLRNELYREHRWLPTAIYKACETARRLVQQQARFTGALSYMLPWLHEQIEEIDEVFGPDFWRHGVSVNRTTLEAFGQLLAAQRFIPRLPRIEDIFVPVEEA